jgi:hypothetical protein
LPVDYNYQAGLGHASAIKQAFFMSRRYTAMLPQSQGGKKAAVQYKPAQTIRKFVARRPKSAQSRVNVILWAKQVKFSPEVLLLRLSAVLG